MLKILALIPYPDNTDAADSLGNIRERLIAHFEKYSREGDPRTAKYAVRCIVRLCGKVESLAILEKIVEVRFYGVF